jgi:hypothetical protein
MINQLPIGFDGRLAHEPQRAKDRFERFWQLHFSRNQKSSCHFIAPDYHHTLMKSRQKQQ